MCVCIYVCIEKEGYIMYQKLWEKDVFSGVF